MRRRALVLRRVLMPEVGSVDQTAQRAMSGSGLPRRGHPLLVQMARSPRASS
jgi:hypothetical protein